MHRLRIIGNEKQTVDLDKDILHIGRDPSNDIVLNDETVGRHQAIIMVQEEEVSLVDLGRVNPTCVNGQPIAQRTVLRDLDKISMGAVEAELTNTATEGMTKAMRPIAPAQPAFSNNQAANNDATILVQSNECSDGDYKTVLSEAVKINSYTGGATGTAAGDANTPQKKPILLYLLISFLVVWGIASLAIIIWKM